MSTTAYTHVDGVGVSPDGVELWIDYSDWREQHTTLKHRYIISLHAHPRLITDSSERQIGFRDIPEQVFREAEVWLTSQAEVARSQQRDTLAQLFTQHLEHLRTRQ
jgi:hypothetical protein